uniref:Uncharacterized protein n=1 Tax=Lotus japonicus TaxID=34305 RepID=I3S1H5_LOTJA|nr:unknown [Lotus japonicus]
MIKSTGKTGKEAGGTLREPNLVFIVPACSTENVDN